MPRKKRKCNFRPSCPRSVLSEEAINFTRGENSGKVENLGLKILRILQMGQPNRKPAPAGRGFSQGGNTSKSPFRRKFGLLGKLAPDLRMAEQPPKSEPRIDWRAASAPQERAGSSRTSCLPRRPCGYLGLLISGLGQSWDAESSTRSLPWEARPQRVR